MDSLSVRQGGFRYLRPYNDAEEPDSMVQLAVLLPMLDYLSWRGEDAELPDELRAGLGRFFNEKVGSIVRYLPTVDEDHNPWKIDSWYLYHPLMSLGRLAQHGDEKEQQLFLRSLEYGIKVAHHFDYRWPIDFDLKSLEANKAQRNPGKPGESDVAGLYAYTMLQALALTGAEWYLDEAKQATRRLEGLGFDIGYQFNNVAWGITACLGVWRTTGDEVHQHRAGLLLASFFHNSYVWEVRFGPAEHFPTFMGVACLHDGPYMAAFEEYETCLAFQEALRLGGEDLPESMRMLMAEYCRHLLDRGWFYYPSELPKEVLAAEPRNGHIDRSLTIPLEDLYVTRQSPGQVGQETYGCGLAFSLTTNAFRRLKDSPGLLYCDYPLLDLEVEAGRATLGVAGVPRLSCCLAFLPAPDKPTPKVEAALLPRGGRVPKKLKPIKDDPFEFRIPGGSRVMLSW